KPLLELRDYLEEQFEANHQWATYARWLKLIAHRDMDRTLNDCVGDTPVPEKRLQYWAADVQTTILAARTLAGVPEAPEHLLRYAKWVLGRIRLKVKEQDVPSVLQ